MRFTPDRHFLHPVLGLHTQDYPNKSFDVELPQPISASRKLKWVAEFCLDVAPIHQLLSTGEAVCTVIVYCSATSYRQAFTSQNDIFKVPMSIDIHNLRGKVEFNPQIILAEEAIYDTSEASIEYGGVPIRLGEGSPLAMHQPFQIQANDEDKTQPIFKFETVTQLEDNEWDVAIDPKSAFIIIRCNATTKSRLDEARQKDANAAIPTLYLSVMSNVLEHFRTSQYSHEEPDENDPKVWWHVIKQQCESKYIFLTGEDELIWAHRSDGIEYPRSSMWVASKLFDDPLTFAKIIEGDNND